MILHVFHAKLTCQRLVVSNFTEFGRNDHSTSISNTQLIDGSFPIKGCMRPAALLKNFLISNSDRNYRPSHQTYQLVNVMLSLNPPTVLDYEVPRFTIPKHHAANSIAKQFYHRSICEYLFYHSLFVSHKTRPLNE